MASLKTSNATHFVASTPQSFSVSDDKMDHSGFTVRTTNLLWNTSRVDLSGNNETLTCLVWKEPARIVLEVSVLLA